MANVRKEKKWFKPTFNFDDTDKPKPKVDYSKSDPITTSSFNSNQISDSCSRNLGTFTNINHKSWMKQFDPVTVEDLAIHYKKIQEVEDWLKSTSTSNCSKMLLITGPVGCGKTITIQTLARKYNIKITEWITPLDIDMLSENGEFEYKEKQTTKFLDFIINAANFTSLLDDNAVKLVLIEDFPNTFLRNPLEFTEILNQYKCRAKSPIAFICSESHTDSKNTFASLFTTAIIEQFQIQHISFNSVSVTGLRSALKRVSDIISKNHTSIYDTPTTEMIECVVHSSAGDVRSAVLNLHFACLKGSSCNLETSMILEKESKSKAPKRKKQSSNKFLSLGKDQTVSILHGVGRVLNPKVITENGQAKLTHPPNEIIDQFLSLPSTFVNFLFENYIPHFASIEHADKAADALSEADFMLSEWMDKTCQEYGLYTAIAGLMLANTTPVSAWNPVRGPKNMKIQYPVAHNLRLLDEHHLYKGKVLVTDYQTYHKIICKQ